MEKNERNTSTFSQTSPLNISPYRQSPERHYGLSITESDALQRLYNIRDFGYTIPVTPNTSISGNKNHKFQNSMYSICSSCNKNVYVTEVQIVNRRIYHKQCFKCVKCKGKLGLNNFWIVSNQPFCRVHYKELCELTGNVDSIKFESLQDVEDIFRSRPVVKINYDERGERPPKNITLLHVLELSIRERPADAQFILPKTILPPFHSNVFNKFKTTPLTKVKKSSSFSVRNMHTPSSAEMLRQISDNRATGISDDQINMATSSMEALKLNIMKDSKASAYIKNDPYHLSDIDFAEVLKPTPPTSPILNAVKYFKKKKF